MDTLPNSPDVTKLLSDIAKKPDLRPEDKDQDRADFWQAVSKQAEAISDMLRKSHLINERGPAVGSIAVLTVASQVCGSTQMAAAYAEKRSTPTAEEVQVRLEAMLDVMVANFHFGASEMMKKILANSITPDTMGGQIDGQG